MKLIALITLVTKDAKGNKVEIQPGKEFDAAKADVDSYIERGFAAKPAGSEPAEGDKKPEGEEKPEA